MTWKKCTIGDLCDSVSITYRGNAKKVVLINTSDVFDGKILNHDFVANEGLKGQFKKTFAENDILYSEIRPANRRFAFVDFCGTKNYIASTKLMVIRPRTDKVRPRFLYAILTAQTVIDELQHLAETRSGTFPQITFNGEVAPIPVRLPSFEAQDAIVSIIDSIDGKIDENRKINHNLQQQAKAIFDEWFIKIPQSTQDTLKITSLGYFPDSFSVVKTGELPIVVADYVANGSFASLKENVKLYQSKNYAYFIRNTDLKSGSFEVFVDKHSYDFLSKSRLLGGEIIISNVGDVGSVFLCPTLDAPMTLGNNIIMIKSDIPELRLFLYIWFKWSLGQGLIQGIKSGSAQPKFNKTDFKNLPIILPPSELLQKFNSTVSPIFEMIERNDNENRKLSSLRDSILPKLMSGEIDVSEVEV